MPKHYVKLRLEIESFLALQQLVEPHTEEILADFYAKSTIKKEEIINTVPYHKHTTHIQIYTPILPLSSKWFRFSKGKIKHEYK